MGDFSMLAKTHRYLDDSEGFLPCCEGQRFQKTGYTHISGARLKCFGYVVT
jgi:hypothetical protein